VSSSNRWRALFQAPSVSLDGADGACYSAWHRVSDGAVARWRALFEAPSRDVDGADGARYSACRVIDGAVARWRALFQAPSRDVDGADGARYSACHRVIDGAVARTISGPLQGLGWRRWRAL
jgi:hypothetical protein